MGIMKKLQGAAALFVGGGPTGQAYLVAAGVAAALTAVAFIWHGRQVEALREEAFKAGQADVQDQWDRAVDEAESKQEQQNEQATDQFITEREVVRVQYRDRIKEIKTYVPNPDTSCPADPGFLQRYNAADAPPAGGTTDQ